MIDINKHKKYIISRLAAHQFDLDYLYDRANELEVYHLINIPELLLGSLGLSGEAGEVVDLTKKLMFHEKDLDDLQLKIKQELGDTLFYFFVILDALNISIEEVIQATKDKLEARFPSGQWNKLENEKRKD